MKRGIKFRGWGFDGECYTCDFIMSNHGEVYHCEYGNLVASATGVAIEQFTGLLDKNGVEIYEGDILKDDLDNVVVYFSSDMASFAVNDENGNYFMLADCSSAAEVIGNIHENPELIGKNNA